MTEYLVKATHLVKTFQHHHHWLQRPRNVHAVNAVNLRIKKGETYSIVGESGCGKSTLARLLMGLEKPSQGTISLSGLPQAYAAQSTKDLARCVQYVFQDALSSLNPRQSVAEALSAPMIYLYQTPLEKRQKKLVDLMRAVRLDPALLTRYPHELSGGQAQRVNIARALAAKPQLIILDEPVSALDASVQAQILNLLKDLRQTFNLTYLLISHNLAVVESLSDRIGVMYFGEIVEEASTAELFQQPKHPYTELLLHSILQPGQNTPITPISQELPDPLNPPVGCPFQSRCPIAETICQHVHPKLSAQNAHTHAVRCLMRK